MKLPYLIAGLAGSGVLAATSVIGIASAASSPKTGTVGQSGIPRSVLKQDRLDAEAAVLHTTTAAIEQARSNHSLRYLIVSSGMTAKTFRADVRSQLISELESQGYSKDQVIIALQHRTIGHLRQHDHDS